MQSALRAIKQRAGCSRGRRVAASAERSLSVERCGRGLDRLVAPEGACASLAAGAKIAAKCLCRLAECLVVEHDFAPRAVRIMKNRPRFFFVTRYYVKP
jgi:hypothetical protein